MKTFRWLVLGCLALAKAFGAEPPLLKVQLPEDVVFLGFESQAGAVELKLSASALQHRIALPASAALRMEGTVCIVRIVIPGESPAFQLARGETIAIQFASSEAVASTAERPPARNTSPGAERPATAAPGSASATSTATSSAAPPAPSLRSVIAEFFGTEAIGFDPVAKADYALPESPAAAALGSTSTLLRPATPRETITSLLNSFDEEGRLLPGFSVAVTPYTLFRARPLTSEEYRRPLERFLANLQISVAGKSDKSLSADGARLSGGLSLLFFDDGDLRLDNGLLADINAALRRPSSFSDEIMTGRASVDSLPAQSFAAARTLWEKRKAENWNKASAGIGLAPAFFTRTGKMDDLESDGVAMWASFAHPGFGRLARSTQFIFGGSARWNQDVAIDGVFARTDTIDFGAQLRFGSPDFNGFAETVHRRRARNGVSDTSDFVYEVGLEKRISTGLWLNLSWSNDDQLTGGETIRSGLRYGFGDKAVLATPSP